LEIYCSFFYQKLAKDRELQAACQLIDASLEYQLDSRLADLNSQLARLAEDADLTEALVYEIERELQTRTDADLAAKKYEFIQKSRLLLAREPSIITNSASSIDFVNELVPVFDSVTLRLDDFSNLSDYPVYAPLLEINGVHWSMWVYPKGHSATRGEFLSVCFGPADTSCKPYNDSIDSGTTVYECQVEMLHQLSHNPAKSFVQEYVGEFLAGGPCVESRFYRLNSLADDGFLVNDELVIRFRVN
jgi:hypothetical protein